VTIIPDIVQALTSRLLSLDELGELADLVIEFRANRNGGTHAENCRSLRTQATATQYRSIAEYRVAEPELRPCANCGGGSFTLADDHVLSAESLVDLWKARLVEEREKAVAARLAEEEKNRADAVDKRAQEITWGWEWVLAKEMERAADYSDQLISAAVPCGDCEASATITFAPRTLTVTFACPTNPIHGYKHIDGEDDPLRLWAHGERDYVARALVAPTLAGSDPYWERAYGTRVADYRATTAALADFDAANPKPMELVPAIRCGECGSRMAPHPEYVLYEGRKIEASYSCDARHEDGRHRRRDRKDVDDTIDWLLVRTLSHHPSWAGTPKLEPAPELLAQYADYLAARAALYDEHIGSAAADAELARMRAELGDAITMVAAMRANGALRTAGVAGPREWGPWSTINPASFSDLARALLTERVEVTETTIDVATRFDEGTPLYRTLRAREIREELVAMRRREEELTAELAALEATG
jgi:hypothetical protein